MTRLTKRLRDQLVDIEKAQRKKAGKRCYSDADLAAVRAVTARLEEGLKPKRPVFDSAVLQAMITQQVAAWSKQMAAQISNAPSYFKNGAVLTAGTINRPRQTGKRADLLVLDDLHMAPILGHDRDDMADAFRYAATTKFPVVIDRGADFGVMNVNITA